MASLGNAKRSLAFRDQIFKQVLTDLRPQCTLKIALKTAMVSLLMFRPVLFLPTHNAQQAVVVSRVRLSVQTPFAS